MTTKVTDISTFLNNVASALGLKHDDYYIIKLKEELSKLSTEQNLRVIEDPDIGLLITQLISADNELQDFYDEYSATYSEGFKSSWLELSRQFAKIQALSLLDKTANCDEVINDLMKRLHNKLNSVNLILEKNLNKGITKKNEIKEPKQEEDEQEGGTYNEYYKKKYIKYKEKYLRLFNNA